MKALVCAFNQEKALVGAFSVIVQPVVEPIEHYTALVLISTLPVLPSCGGGPRYLRMHQILWKYLHSSWENICSAETDLLGNLMALRSHCRWTHGDNATILTSVCVHVQCSPSKKLFLTFISNKSSRTIECNFLCFNCLLFPFEIIVRTLDTYLGFNFLLRPDDYLEAFPKEPR